MNLGFVSIYVRLYFKFHVNFDKVNVKFHQFIPDFGKDNKIR